ncbi:FliH/SctL family protein [Desulfosoma caldarium]|uniref:Flagellar assembly protein FliH n=1 Tax=Desulfosoma caldarium TaxID=610254 RepID=A0A3N1VNR9_9BACT|nr:FliH/SctL family protein [Desulfosoma caldarium]ROR01872.1 flagellar biosynthesis/type III secretory pathway protein FliH [Desulfosoma caldarium]
MPSFKVLKGTDRAGVSRFAFEPLDPKSLQEGGSRSSEGSVPSKESMEVSGHNPLDDLEELVRQRLLEAERRAEELEREAYQKGYEQGQKDGYAFGASGIEKIRERLNSLAASLEQIPQQVLHEYRDWLIEAALTLSRHLLTEAVSINPTVLESLVDHILEHMDRSHAITIVLHPNDRDLLQKHGVLERWLSPPPKGQASLQVTVDPSIQRGGCRFESAMQDIDALVETRLRNLREILFSHAL